MYNVIFKRRSVRFFKSNPISKVDMREILRAGMWAPSAKNRQPWKFVVVRGKSKDEMLALMEKGIERSEKGEGVLAGSSDLYTNARFTLKCMKEAYNIVFIVNPNGRDIEEEWTPADKIHELSDVQASAQQPRTWHSRPPPWASAASGSETSSSPTKNSPNGSAKDRWSSPWHSATRTTTPARSPERAKTKSSKLETKRDYYIMYKKGLRQMRSFVTVLFAWEGIFLERR